MSNAAFSRLIVIDYDVIEALRRLLAASNDDLEPSDLPKIEVALRAFVPGENIAVPYGSYDASGPDYQWRIGDGILDYELADYYPQPQVVSPSEAECIRTAVDEILAKSLGKPLAEVTVGELSSMTEKLPEVHFTHPLWSLRRDLSSDN
jgi:hypothetical protein